MQPLTGLTGCHERALFICILYYAPEESSHLSLIWIALLPRAFGFTDDMEFVLQTLDDIGMLQVEIVLLAHVTGQVIELALGFTGLRLSFPWF